MFEEYYADDIELLTPTDAMSDGEVVYSNSICKGLKVEDSVTASGSNIESGQYGTVFVLQSDQAPISGCKIVHNQTTYLIGEIQVCRTFDGEIASYRCSVR